jgi:hypothetical protein
MKDGTFNDHEQSYNMKDGGRQGGQETHQGTPNDVRMFPVKMAPSSQTSIPIAIKKSPSELQLHEDMVLAEFREHRMYRRIVTGMNVKSENLDGIILAGNSRVVPKQCKQQQQHSLLGIATQDIQMAYNSSYATTTAYTYNHMTMPPPETAEVPSLDAFLEEDEGIFELEL